jgi:WD40 repeat protein
MLAVASVSGGIELLRADLKESLGKLAAPESPILAGESKSSVIALAPDGQHAAAGRPTGRVYLWTVEGGQDKGALNVPAHSGPVEGLEFTAAGLLSLGRDGQLKLWNLAEGKELVVWSFDTPLARGWLLAGGRAAAIIRQPGAAEVQLYRLPTKAGESPALLASISLVEVFDGFALRGADMSVEHLALSPDGTRLALAFQAGSAGLTNARVAFYDVAATIGTLMPALAASTSLPATTDPAAKPAADFRTWTSADGNFRVEAQLASFRGNIVTLRRKDNGKLIPLKLEQLSKEDQELVRGNK